MKDTFYFPHDSNAHNDRKMIKLRREYGMEGVGLFWTLIEIMSEETDRMLPLCEIDADALQMQCEPDKLKIFITDCIEKFHLFDSDGEFYWSNTLRKRLAKVKMKSAQTSEAAKVRWHKERNADAMQTHMQTHSVCNANRIEYNIKEKNREYILHRLLQIYEKALSRTMNEIEIEKVHQAIWNWLEKYSEETIEEVIVYVAEQGKLNVGYCSKVLPDWEQKKAQKKSENADITTTKPQPMDKNIAEFAAKLDKQRKQTNGG